MPNPSPNRYQSLHASYAKAESPSIGHHSTIRVRENRCSYAITGCKTPLSVVYHVDGGIYPIGTKPRRCDYFVLLQEKTNSPVWKEIFIELKGVNYTDALEQIITTLGQTEFKKDKRADRYVRIVCTHFPDLAQDTKVRALELKIKNSLNCHFSKHSITFTEDYSAL